MGLGSIVAYLEQGLGRIVRAGLESLSTTVVPGATATSPGQDSKLLHPALKSRKQTMMALLALELRARNPYERAHHRARHRRRLEAFVRESRLAAALMPLAKQAMEDGEGGQKVLELVVNGEGRGTTSGRTGGVATKFSGAVEAAQEEGKEERKAGESVGDD